MISDISTHDACILLHNLSAADGHLRAAAGLSVDEAAAEICKARFCLAGLEVDGDSVEQEVFCDEPLDKGRIPAWLRRSFGLQVQLKEFARRPPADLSAEIGMALRYSPIAMEPTVILPSPARRPMRKPFE